MKIIGETQTGFILDAHKDELAQLIGYFYAGDRCPSFNVGQVIQVNVMYDQLTKVKNLRSNVKQIDVAAGQLLDAIRFKGPLLDPVADAIVKAEPKR